MRILIFDGRFPTSHAKDLAERLRSEGHNVGFRNADRFTGNVERLAGRVYADTDEVRAAYGAAGTTVQHLTGSAQPAPESSTEYEMESRGRWWYVVGPGGDVNEKGLTKADADALMAEVADA